MQHEIYTWFEGDRGYWECSCGRSGSSDADRVDLASDKHINYPDERRVEISKPRW